MSLTFSGERVIPDQMAIDVATYQAHLTRYTWALNYCADLWVADCASGSGYGSWMLADVARHVDGYEISAEAIEYANQFYKRPNVDFYQLDLSTQTLKDEYDVIVSLESVEHMRDPKHFIETVRICLRRRGKFVFSIPRNNASQFHIHTYSTQQARDLIEPHFKHVDWFEQEGMNIFPYSGAERTFMLGVASV